MIKNKQKSNIAVNYQAKRKMPRRILQFINFCIKTSLGFVIFWFIFQRYEIIIHDHTIIEQISYIMLISTISSTIALIISGIILHIIFKLFKATKPKLWELNNIKRIDQAVYTILSFTLGSILLIVGWYVYLGDIANSFWQYLIFYVIMKFVIYFFLKLIANYVKDNIWIVLGTVVIFVSLLLISIVELIGGNLKFV